MCAYGCDSGATLPLASAFPQGASGAASGLAIAAAGGLSGLRRRAILSRLRPDVWLWRPGIALKSPVFCRRDGR